MLAFKTLKVVGGAARTIALVPVYVKKLPSTLVTFSGTIKSEMMSASPAIAIWKIARTSLNINSCLHVIKAMAEKLKAKKELIEYVNDVLPVTWAFNSRMVIVRGK